MLLKTFLVYIPSLNEFPLNKVLEYVCILNDAMVVRLSPTIDRNEDLYLKWGLKDTVGEKKHLQ
jgi:hypothetical protein